MKLQDTLKGGYRGLHGEVVTEDQYRLRQLPFTPDVIIDLGANIGIFSRFARDLFPDALIIAVEPDPDNIEVFKKFTDDKRIILIEKAIGKGKLYKCIGATNGAHECYLSPGLGYPEKEMKNDERLELVEIETVTLSEIIKQQISTRDFFPDDKWMVKIDVEGNEHSIFTDLDSMDLLTYADYVCIEIHWYALTGNLIQEVKDKTLEALALFDFTHNIIIDNQYFWALKKGYEYKV